MNDALKELRKALLGRELISVDLVHKWLLELDDTLVAELSTALVTKPDVFDSRAIIQLANSLIDPLLAASADSSTELTQGDALELLKCLFSLFWMRFSTERAILDKIKKGFARLLWGWPKNGEDLVILCVLEHLFGDWRIKNYFSYWSKIPELSAAYDESVRLSRGWE